MEETGRRGREGWRDTDTGLSRHKGREVTTCQPVALEVKLPVLKMSYKQHVAWVPC